MDKPNFEIKNIHNPKESLEEKIIVGKCPECNGDLVQRYGKYEKFYACSNYPTCKYIKQEERQVIEICKCPQCDDGIIIEKSTKKGKVYYGCNNYPKCSYVVWDYPVSGNTIQNKKIDISNNDEIKIDNQKYADETNQKLEKYSEQFKQGYREDLQMEFRSSWEANIARILNHLKIEYTFEKDMYRLKSNVYDPKYKFASRSYIPDFILKNGIVLEVKGNYDLRSLKNLELFAKLYPNETLKIIDSDIYYLLSKKYSAVIENWEEKAKITSFTIPVVGINMKGRKSFVDKLNIDDDLYLERESTNDYDKNAIKVLDKGNNHIGYIPSDYAVIYAPKIDAGIKYTLKLKKKEDKRLEVFIKANNLDEIDITSIIEVF